MSIRSYLSLLVGLAAFCTIGFTATLRAESSLPGWDVARWKMTSSALDKIYGGRLQKLDPPIDFGIAYVDRVLRDGMYADLDFTVYFQMDPEKHYLIQVLLERRRGLASPAAFKTLLLSLNAEYGAPVKSCLVNKAEAEPFVKTVIWKTLETTVEASFFDFNTTAILHEDPQKDNLDPLIPYSERKLFSRRGLPRRILLRFHPESRDDLSLGIGCHEPQNDRSIK
ncbi:MAG: hypothetical protein R3E60_07145 [Alphaproteobacteria bacterium]